jgi:hypothetical protein
MDASSPACCLQAPTPPLPVMATSRMRPQPRHLDEWDESADVTLQLSDLLQPTSNGHDVRTPWDGDVDLAEQLLGGDLLTTQGDLEGNLFHQPILNPTRHDRPTISTSHKRPSTEEDRRDRPTEGKRSRTSTNHRATVQHDPLPTPSPEPTASAPELHGHSRLSAKSREPSTSSGVAAPRRSDATVNNAVSSSSRAPMGIAQPQVLALTVEAVEEAPSSSLDVLSWRDQTEGHPDPSGSHEGRAQRELMPVDLARSRSRSTSTAHHHRTEDPGHQSLTAESSASAGPSRPIWGPKSTSKPAASRTDAHLRRTSSVHSSTSVALSTFKTSATINPQPRTANLLDRSTSSSSSLAGPSRSYLADRPAKDDLYERKKRDSYIGPNGVLGPEDDSEPPSPPRAVRPRGAGQEKDRAGARPVGGKRIEVSLSKHCSCREETSRLIWTFYALVETHSSTSQVSNPTAQRASDPSDRVSGRQSRRASSCCCLLHWTQGDGLL